ncbi:hypothetical protein HRD49_45140, partial [Corallococcus exiguus]|uniref:hypothetical protein n=1 Tax=Corallococcus exiguus TaxID=83462 RepID=UPI001C273E68
MEALLAALAPRPIRWLARMTATAVVAGVLGTLAAYGLTQREGGHCEQEVEKLTVAWSPARRERIRTAFLSTGASYAAPA